MVIGAQDGRGGRCSTQRPHDPHRPEATREDRHWGGGADATHGFVADYDTGEKSAPAESAGLGSRERGRNNISARVTAFSQSAGPTVLEQAGVPGYTVGERRTFGADPLRAAQSKTISLTLTNRLPSYLRGWQRATDQRNAKGVK